MTTASVTERPLTQKQESFCLFIFQGLPQRNAYLKAGYSGKQGLTSIDENSCRLAADIKISTRIAELRLKAESAAIGTVTERQKRLLVDDKRHRLCDWRGRYSGPGTEGTDNSGGS